MGTILSSEVRNFVFVTTYIIIINTIKFFVRQLFAFLVSLTFYFFKPYNYNAQYSEINILDILDVFLFVITIVVFLRKYLDLFIFYFSKRVEST